MSNIIIANGSQPGLRTANRPIIDYGNLEAMAFRNVVQDAWRKKVKNDKVLADALEEHALHMRRMLGNMEYETFCIVNLLTHAKNMDKDEIVNYMKMIEGLTEFYKDKLGIELTSAILTGITYKARDAVSLNKYYNMAMNELEGKRKYLEFKHMKETQNVDKLALELKFYQSSLLRFFRGKKMAVLRNRITKRNGRITKIERSIVKNSSRIESINRIVKGPRSSSV